MIMENAEEIFHFLEDFSKRKPKSIPQELNDYLAFVARTGDPVYQWPLVKCLFKEKLLNVITDFYETTPSIEIPPYPNVDPFNYDTMKNSLLERLDSFTSAPFTVQRLCELLTFPRKEYNRVDRFMRAIEKNILVVSTREPGIQRHVSEADIAEPIVNGSDNNSDYNVDVEMEDLSWKEHAESQPTSEPQPSSSDVHISVDDIEARLKAKENAPMEVQDKIASQYESVTPPELNVTTDEPANEIPVIADQQPTTLLKEEDKSEQIEQPEVEPELEKAKLDIEMKTEELSDNQPLIIPEIKVDDAEMTEQRLNDQINAEKSEQSEQTEKDSINELKSNLDYQQSNIDESSSDSNSKDDAEIKINSDVPTSSEESSSSSDNTDVTDGNSNSPKGVETVSEVTEESNQSDSNIEEEKQQESEPEKVSETTNVDVPQAIIENENYTISDVNSELPQTVNDNDSKETVAVDQKADNFLADDEKHDKSENKEDNVEVTMEKSET